MAQVMLSDDDIQLEGNKAPSAEEYEIFAPPFLEPEPQAFDEEEKGIHE